MQIPYVRKISKRGRNIRLSVHPGGQVIVSAPARVDESTILKFMNRKIKWITAKIDKLKNVQPFDAGKSRRSYVENKEKARELVMRRLPELNAQYGFKYNRVSIKNHKTLWGSCSRRGNLNFSHKIVLVTSEQADYIMVHELCHLGEFNHSPRFWALVAQSIPNYKELRNQLRAHGMTIS